MFNGMILFETDDIVVIATYASKNKKTGDMVQIWILSKNVDGVKSGRMRCVVLETICRLRIYLYRTIYRNDACVVAIYGVTCMSAKTSDAASAAMGTVTGTS